MAVSREVSFLRRENSQRIELGFRRGEHIITGNLRGDLVFLAGPSQILLGFLRRSNSSNDLSVMAIRIITNAGDGLSERKIEDQVRHDDRLPYTGRLEKTKERLGRLE
jgi:hypothetical protein